MIVVLGLAVMTVAVAGFVLVKVLWMLRQPEGRLYRPPQEGMAWAQFGGAVFLTVLLLVSGHLIAGSIFAVLLVPLYWMTRRSIRSSRYRQRGGGYD